MHTGRLGPLAGAGGSHRTALSHQLWVVRPLVVICLLLLLHFKYAQARTK